MRNLTFAEAINEALHQEMERDPAVFTYGIGVPDHTDVFGTTKGLRARFGEDRCFDTPLCEETMTGFALGAALNGLRPIHVHMRVDFLLLAMNQLVNMISSYRYLTGGKTQVPLVIRAIVGRAWGQGAQHSKTLHSFFAHIPGLKVVLPTTPRDAKGLMAAAIRDPNPVVFLEHRWLHSGEGDVPEEPYTVPIGPSHVLRPGSDVTVVATSWMNVEALKAAEIMQRRGVSVEIVDARTIAPFDDTVIVESVKKTGRCVVADNDWVEAGFGAEIAARVGERCFGELKSPIRRIGFAFTPCPTGHRLERAFYPSAFSVVRAIEGMLGLEPADLTKEDFYSNARRFRGPF